MNRIALDSDIHPLSDFRSNFSGFINQVHTTRRPIVITQHGRGSAVLLDVAEYERMIDSLELINDIELATRQIDEGKGMPHEKVRKRLKGRITE
jgi:prevent-host-death family protein